MIPVKRENAMLTFLLLLAAQGGPDKAAAPLQTLATARGYEFTIEDAKQPGKAVTGKYQKGAPVFFRADNIEFFRAGKVLVYKDAGTWHRPRTGTISDPLRILAGTAKVRSARLPHEELAQLDKLWTGIKKDIDKGQTRLSGDLDKKAAEQLAPAENRSVAQDGKAQVWLDKDGQVIRYLITIRLQGRRGNVEVNGTAARSISVSGVGATKVDVPAEAKKLLE